MNKPLVITQVCRRFGPVGGMERYVWELSRELSLMGHHIHILCEQNLCTEPLSGVHIHALGTVRPKPRWLAHIRFSRHVHTWLKQQQIPEMIIHSHERTQDHHITTFHGPPFAKILDLPLWKRFSLRSNMNLWLERRELCGAQVQMIVPNSKQISRQLQHYYPSVNSILMNPIVPGVTATCSKRPLRVISNTAGTVGFIGKEWRRKGLEVAIAIISKLYNKRPNLHFIIAGPIAKDIKHLFASAPFKFTLLGEVNVDAFYPQLDVLLHPASSEPYGMVITEALSAGVPAVISDVCGAASEITPQRGSTLPLTAPINTWVEELHQWLNCAHKHVDYKHSWHNTASSYEQLYKRINLNIPEK